MPQVSIIVPVHNAVTHIHQCLDSILAQTFEDFELICVDDGSTDETPEILADYSQRDSRITIVTQDNAFAGTARNNGMLHATGKYLVFWDADDYFMPEAIQSMYEKCEADTADLCVCGAKRYYETLDREISTSSYMRSKLLPETIPFSQASCPDYILNFTNESVWNKMFLREFVEREQLQFQPIRNGNDVYFVICALCLAERITVIERPLVCYRTLQESSLVGSLSASPITPLQAWIDTRNELEHRDVLPIDSFTRKATSSILYLLRNIGDWDSFSEAVQFLQEEGLQDLQLNDVREREFYLQDWHADCLKHLLSDSPEEFLAYFAFTNYRQYRGVVAEKAVLTRRVRRVRAQKASLEEENATLRQKLMSERERRKAAHEKAHVANQAAKTAKENAKAAKADAMAARVEAEEAQKTADECRHKAEEAEKRAIAARKQANDMKTEINKLQASNSYKIGRAITKPARALKQKSNE